MAPKRWKDRQKDTAVKRLLARVKEEADGEVEVNRLFEAFQFEMIESGSDVKIGKRVFVEYLLSVFPSIRKDRQYKNDTTLTVYRGIVLKQLDLSVQLPPECLPVQFCDLKQFLLPPFVVTKESDSQLICDLDTCVQINGNSVFKKVTFYPTKVWCLEISGKIVDLESLYITPTFQFSKESITGVCKSVQFLNICDGVKVTGSVVVSRYHTVEQFKTNQKHERRVRSIMCNKAVSVTSVLHICRKCQKMTFRQSQSELIKENITPVSAEIKYQNSDNKIKKTTKEDILNLIPNANEEMVELLLSQAQNVGRDPKGRRWTKSVTAVCLQWYCRSPQSYEAFRDSKYLVLPSPSTLILYKNRVKQHVGFDEDVFRWMFDEARRREIPGEGWTGGIILDEMSIQSDIQISKTGDVVELYGLVEIGEEGNICHVMRTGKNDKTIGSHALQMVFLGINGFRFPFAHFMTDGIQAPELYTLFWEAVDRLQTFGFNVIYTCMDGAQSNRSFMNYNIKRNNTFLTQSPCSLGAMIFMMDVSHVIKKIRNNIMKSGLQKTSTRLITLPSSHTVQWQMFLDCFLWDKCNAMQIHRKLTNEHLFPSTQSKMRNHLAEDILNSEMLHLMQVYQIYLGPKGCILDGAIELLKHTSKIIAVFRSKKPVQSKDDERLCELRSTNKWFADWESSAGKPKELMSAQCHQDIHACIVGFLNLCEIILQKKESTIFITPALTNSDVVENTFNQMRATYNGANSNPNALQYRRTLNSIILGQTTVSVKGNAGKSRDSAKLYNCNLPATCLKRKKPQGKHECQPIKVIRC